MTSNYNLKIMIIDKVRFHLSIINFNRIYFNVISTVIIHTSQVFYLWQRFQMERQAEDP